jgi:hypothetical protein
LRKRVPIPIHSTPADRSVGPYPVSLPEQSLKQWEKVKHLLATSYIDLLDPYLQHVISMFNTYSRGLTHRCLTDTDGGYNLRSANFPYHTPPPFPTNRPPLFTLRPYPVLDYLSNYFSTKPRSDQTVSHQDDRVIKDKPEG